MLFSDLGNRPKFERADRPAHLNPVVYACGPDYSGDAAGHVDELAFARRRHGHPNRAAKGDREPARQSA